MAVIPLSFGTFGGGSDEVTATRAQVLTGYTAITADSADEPVEGTIPIKSGQTYYPTLVNQSIAQGQYLGGIQVINKITPANISAENIKVGTTVKVNNGNTDIIDVAGTYSTPSSGQSPIVSSKVLTGYSGFVNGGPEVKGNIPLKQAQTYNVSGSDQNIAAGQYLNGAQVFRGVTTANIDTGNIRKGVVVKVGDAGDNGRIKNVTGTYTTPSAGQSPVVAGAMLQGYSGFVNGGGEVQGTLVNRGQAQYGGFGEGTDYYAINALPEGAYFSYGASWAPEARCSKATVRNLLGVAANKIAKGQSIAGITGTWYGNKATIGVSAYDSRSGSETYDEQRFTMPADGIVYYGGCAGGWFYSDADTNATCAIYKNDAAVNNANINSGNYTFRGGMFNKSFSANAGDVIKVIAACARGNRGDFIMSAIQAVIVY